MNLPELSKQLKIDIDQFCKDKWNEGPRSHLGASEIGQSCSKYLWLKFRWTFYKVHDGRQQRLFQRGHFEEPRFISYLEGIGCKVQQFAKALWYHLESESYFIDDIDFLKNRLDIDAQHCVDVTHNLTHLKLAEEQGVKFDKGKMQIRISAAKGHFGGSCDGICTLPERYNLPDVIFLDEFKTKGTGKGFTELCKDKCKKKAPVHFAQQCIYGYKLNIKYGIYMVVNKNDDDLHVEAIELDWELGKDLERKAEMIVFATEPPAAVSCSPSYYECGFCDAKGVCYGTEQPLKNCRSCKHAFPTEDASWTCEHYGIIPKEAIPIHQPCWESII